MKKLIAFVLAAMMVLSLAACGGDKTAPTTAATTDPTTNPTTEPTTAPTTEPTTAPTTEPTTVPETTEAQAQGSKLGVVEGNTYTNSFLGITATLDENWTFANDEEMAQIRGMTMDAMNDESLSQMLETSGAVMDMYAMDTEGRTLNIMLENLNILQSVALTEKAYVDATVGQLPSVLENMGFANVTAEPTEMIFAGESHAAVKIHASVQGVEFFETMVVVKQGNYIACVTVASYGQDTTANVLEQFTAIVL